MRSHSLKPFDDGKYLSEEEALKLIESIPIPKELEEKVEVPSIPTLPVSSAPNHYLEIIPGNYLTAIQAAIPETIQTSAELQKTRVELNNKNDVSLNDLTFYTANVPLYGMENGNPFLLFGGREAFLQLYVPFIDDVFARITIHNYHILSSADKVWALEEGISSGALTRFDLAELVATKINNEFGYFTIDTSKADKLKGVKRELAELIHGQGNDYFECMQMLAKNNVFQTKIVLLNPEYVCSITKDMLIGRASWLGSVFNSPNFSASVRSIIGNYHLRGARKK